LNKTFLDFFQSHLKGHIGFHQHLDFLPSRLSERPARRHTAL
jgi:hypothetical protein